jgi:steroid delta-isomerase-like uncharacterized protein
MSEQNKALIRGLYDAVNSQNYDAMAAAMADDVVEHEELPGLEPNKDGVMQFFKGCHAAIQGFKINVEDVMAEGDKVTVRGVVTGTHTGEFMGIPASGNALSVGLADYFRIEGGQVKEHWGVMDGGAMLMQMGVVQMPGA